VTGAVGRAIRFKPMACASVDRGSIGFNQGGDGCHGIRLARKLRAWIHEAWLKKNKQNPLKL
jgi:hypothetical protein